MSRLQQYPRQKALFGFEVIPFYAATAVSWLLGNPPVSSHGAALGVKEWAAPLRRGLARRWLALAENRDLYVHDLAVSAVAIVLASLLRMNTDWQGVSSESLWSLVVAVPGFVLTCAAVYPFTCLYARNWRYATVADLLGILRAAGVVTLVFVFVLFAVTRLSAFPRSVMLIEALILAPLLALPRVRRKDPGGRAFGLGANEWAPAQQDMIPVLLLGAGDAADLYLRALQRDPTARHWAVGIILEKGQATGACVLRGVPILGDVDDLEAVVKSLEVRGLKPRQLIFTETGQPDMETLIDRADCLGIAVSRPAPILELRSAKSGNRFELRPIALTDLLERPQAVLDRAALSRMIEGRRILVTGAGGSIGGELTRQVAALGPAQVVVLDHCEYNLYAIDLALSEAFPKVAREACLCDVRDTGRLDEIFERHRPELVFHAAALKHVPMVELNPCEGVLTNVIGTMNVAEAARRCGASAMVQISTDKAVNATSVMGATKRLAELYCQALDLDAADGTSTARFMTVRFGNVLGSSGSLVPLFERQLARGGPLTVTDVEMKRFFMTTREAVELTLQAAAYGFEKKLGQGEIFVLDMGEPIKIIDMARRMIKLAGYRPDEDIKVKVIGRRPGEKLFEELFDENERRVPSPVPGVLGAVPDPVPLVELRRVFAQLRDRAKAGALDHSLDLIAQVLPSYRGRTLPSALAVTRMPDREAAA